MDVLNLLDQLDDLIYHAKPARFRGQARVDPEEVYALLDQIRVSLPEEIKQAEWIVRERRELQREASGNEGLRAAVDSIDGVEYRPAPPPLTPAAAEKVCSIMEEAEAARADAKRQAGEIEAEARRGAEAIVAEAEAKLRRAHEATAGLIRDATDARVEIAGLVERTRAQAATLGEVLGDCAGALAGRVERIRVAADETADAEAHAGGEAPLEELALAEPVAELPSQEQLPSSQATQEWSSVDGVWPEPAADPDPDPSLPGPDAYVHAERLTGEEEGVGDQAAADDPPEPEPALPAPTRRRFRLRR